MNKSLADIIFHLREEKWTFVNYSSSEIMLPEAATWFACDVFLAIAL
jgi:hypothetical protein